ncbi:glycosyltransferase [Ancylobacter mangrovi]|uniref:glycosyltransferase n=1 Tax=Ancylobacter mangrovi TaxID=2972472 RepID=UPI002162CBCE|nr:glycosyltransferase [Ancylobacter mangrovi]MCS0504870.1 glycosyltransferase [Ancylobacter mangrovi]
MLRYIDDLGFFEIRRFDLSFSFAERRRRFYIFSRLRRLWSFIVTAALLPRGAGRVCYLVADGNKGFYFTLGLLAVLRLLGYRIILSVRSFRLLRSDPKLFAKSAAFGGRNLTYMTLCPAMTRSIVDAAGAVKHFEFSNIIFHAPQPEPGGSSGEGPLRVGFISNILPGKGADVFEKLAGRLKDTGAYEFVLAGYARDPEYFASIGELKQPWVDWVGGLEGDAKRDFLQGLDIFVFPTTYPDEAQPNVVFEAATYGAFVITTDIACLAGDVAGLGGVTNPIDDFVDKVAAMLDSQTFRATVRQGRAERLATYAHARDAARANADVAIRSVLDAAP